MINGTEIGRFTSASGNEFEEVIELLDRLRSDLLELRKVPLMEDKYFIDRDDILQTVDDIRVKFPSEFSMAKRIVEMKDELISGAKREAEELKNRAKEEVRALIDKQEIVRQARAREAQIAELTRQRVDEMRKKAEAEALEIRKQAASNVEQSLRHADQILGQAREDVRKVWNSFSK
ncbi:MAG: hypothetical protein LBD85_05760 [Oscillospiraceae bacterium]|jgi:hypothetical protein|nr:hypothetical protein [Oscillospiraceae bacterium]